MSLPDVVISLVSGLVGAVIGAQIGARATFRTTQKIMDNEERKLILKVKQDIAFQLYNCIMQYKVSLERFTGFSDATAELLKQMVSNQPDPNLRGTPDAYERQLHFSINDYVKTQILILEIQPISTAYHNLKFLIDSSIFLTQESRNIFKNLKLPCFQAINDVDYKKRTSELIKELKLITNAIKPECGNTLKELEALWGELNEKMDELFPEKIKL